MTITCVICKRQPIPGDTTRSFHHFPSNSEQSQKWVEITGIKRIIKKVSGVCSDHFGEDSYHQTDGYTTRRRLLSTAVPSLNRNNSVKQVTNHIVTPSSINNTRNMNNVGNSNDDSDDSEYLVTGYFCETVLSYSLPKSTEAETNDKIDMNSKRKQTVSDDSNLLKKKFCFMDKYQPTRISREDFVSDEAWGRFVKFAKYKNRQIAAAKKRASRALAQKAAYKGVSREQSVPIS